MSGTSKLLSNSVRQLASASNGKYAGSFDAVNKHSRAITDGRFDLDAALKSKKEVFALFYAIWCPFSQQFLPHFEKHAEGKGHDCVRITIDDKESLFDKYNVEYMPTVIYFKNGKPKKRLDATPRVGLSEKQLLDLLASCK
jgi:thioredoxin-like negative regulator of GroEL